MIAQEKLNEALYALHFILVRARCMAYENGDRNLARLLDYAEELPRFIAEVEDRTNAYETSLRGIAHLYPNLTHMSKTFEESSAPKKW